MPRAVAPPPSGEFNIRLTKPFSGTPTKTIEVIGEPNRPATVRVTETRGDGQQNEKTGDVPADDVNELTSLVAAVRGFPSNASQDLYGVDTRLELTTFDIQWSNDDEEAAATEAATDLAGEQKDEFKRVVDSIEALARTFAKKDAAV